MLGSTHSQIHVQSYRYAKRHTKQHKDMLARTHIFLEAKKDLAFYRRLTPQVDWGLAQMQQCMQALMSH